MSQRNGTSTLSSISMTFQSLSPPCQENSREPRAWANRVDEPGSRQSVWEGREGGKLRCLSRENSSSRNAKVQRGETLRNSSSLSQLFTPEEFLLSFVGCSRRGKGVSRISARGWQLTRATCENRSRVRKWRPFLEKLDGWARGKTTTSCLCGKTCRGGLGPRRGDELAPFELQARGSIGTSRSPEKRREQHRDDDEDEGRRSEARAATVLHGRWILAWNTHATSSLLQSYNFGTCLLYAYSMGMNFRSTCIRLITFLNSMFCNIVCILKRFKVNFDNFAFFAIAV